MTYKSIYLPATLTEQVKDYITSVIDWLEKEHKLESTDGMAIYDTMQYIKCDVSTICLGMAASMGSFLLAAGAKGKRFALPNSEIMIHQPSGGAQGQATDISIHADHILRVKKRLNTLLSEKPGSPLRSLKGIPSGIIL